MLITKYVQNRQFKKIVDNRGHFMATLGGVSHSGYLNFIFYKYYNWSHSIQININRIYTNIFENS